MATQKRKKITVFLIPVWATLNQTKGELFGFPPKNVIAFAIFPPTENHRKKHSNFKSVVFLLLAFLYSQVNFHRSPTWINKLTSIDTFKLDEDSNQNIPVIEVVQTWHSPYILVDMDPLLTYLLVSVPSILTLRYQKKCTQPKRSSGFTPRNNKSIPRRRPRLT